MDINFLFTFGVPAALAFGVGWNFYKKRKQLQDDAIEIVEDTSTSTSTSTDDLQPVRATTGKTQRLSADDPTRLIEFDDRALEPAKVGKASKTKLGTIGDPISLRQVVEHLNDRIDEVPHWMCVGGTGAGKSTFCRLILAYRVARGEQFIILAGKRTAVFADIPSVGRDLIAADGVIKFDRIQAVARALLTEVILRDQMEFDQRNFQVLNIVIDDASILLSEVEEVVQLARTVALIGREIKMRLIILTGSKLLKELGLEGRGDLRDHFAIVTYHKKLDGSRITLLRPRYDENEDSPFDASRVPELSAGSAIDASMAWDGIRSVRDVTPVDDDTLLDPVITRGAKGFYGVSPASNTSNNNAGVTLARYNEVLRRLMLDESQHTIAREVGVSLATVNAISKSLKGAIDDVEA